MKSKSAQLVRRNHARYHRGRDDLNIVPMIDMMVILVFFLIFTAVFSKTNILQLNLPANTNSVPLDLPKTQAAAISDPKPPVILSLNRAGEVFIGDERIEAGDLAERLSGLAAEDPTRIVYVRGDQTISYAQLMEALGMVNRAGFGKVSLIAEAAGSK